MRSSTKYSILEATRATFVRDARETSDYATGKFSQGFKRSHSQDSKEEPPQKKAVVAKKDPIKFSGNQVQVQGQTRKVTGFNKPFARQNQSFRFQSEQDKGNKKPGQF